MSPLGNHCGFDSVLDEIQIKIPSFCLKQNWDKTIVLRKLPCQKVHQYVKVSSISMFFGVWLWNRDEVLRIFIDEVRPGFPNSTL